MPTVETSIWLALRARVASLSLSPALQVAWPKEAFTPPQSGSPPKPQPYLEVSHLPNSNIPHGVADDATYQRQGILQITLKSHTALNHAEAVQAEIVGKIVEHFPVGQRMTYGDVMLKVEKTPDVASSFRDDTDPYWQTPVSVRYFAFI